jgi:hypothetical protein
MKKIFNKLNVVVAAVAVLSIGAAPVIAQQFIGQKSINVTGAAAIGGNVGSIFDAEFGTNEVTKAGETRTIIESSLGGFCTDGDCSDTTLSIDLMASEQGDALTTAGGNLSGVDVMGQNSGQFSSAVQAGIDFGGQTTNIATQGAAAFSNNGVINATGGNASSLMELYGSGQTVSTMGTNGTACPTCVDFSGGTTSTTNSGMSLMSTASGGQSGQLVKIGHSAQSESATSVGSVFSQ